MQSADDTLSLARRAIRAAGYAYEHWCPLYACGPVLAAGGCRGRLPVNEHAGKILVERGLLEAYPGSTPRKTGVSVAALGELIARFGAADALAPESP